MVNLVELLFPSSSESFMFVRRYLRVIFLFICLPVLAAFMGFSYKSTALIKGQMLKQGRAFFKEIILTRQWASDHGGVYVRLTTGVKVNPYLERIPGLKVVITDRDGERYTLKNPALMTREISELAARNGGMKFRMTSLKPLNPNNAPDRFETDALQSFERGNKEYEGYERIGEKTYYRYMAPLVTAESCLRCHAAQGYRKGDIRGGVSVSIEAGEMLQQMNRNRNLLVASALGLLGLIYAIIRYISEVFIARLKAVELQLTEMASKDFLTGLINRREMFKRAVMECSRTTRNAKPLSVLMVDIDHFKHLNDNYGHDAGDEALKSLARSLDEFLRNYDIVCRYGGEEFLVVVPEADLDQARELAERLRQLTANLVIPCGAGGAKVTITVSIGIAQREEEEGMASLISRADEALYRAKVGGRNRVAA
jgi:diguanylate cyclase (GGDEF)-like protein